MGLEHFGVGEGEVEGLGEGHCAFEGAEELAERGVQFRVELLVGLQAFGELGGLQGFLAQELLHVGDVQLAQLHQHALLLFLREAVPVLAVGEGRVVHGFELLAAAEVEGGTEFRSRLLLELLYQVLDFRLQSGGKGGD